MTREEAIQVLQTALTAPFIYGNYANALNMAIEALSAEAVDVVRCKDCWYLNKKVQLARNYYLCTKHTKRILFSYSHGVQLDDYCSWGERK